MLFREQQHRYVSTRELVLYEYCDVRVALLVVNLDYSDTSAYPTALTLSTTPGP